MLAELTYKNNKIGFKIPIEYLEDFADKKSKLSIHIKTTIINSIISCDDLEAFKHIIGLIVENKYEVSTESTDDNLQFLILKSFEINNKNINEYLNKYYKDNYIKIIFSLFNEPIKFMDNLLLLEAALKNCKDAYIKNCFNIDIFNNLELNNKLSVFDLFVKYDADLPLDNINFNELLHKKLNHNITSICRYLEKRNYSLSNKEIKILISIKNTEEELKYLIDKHKEKFINIDFKKSIYDIIEGHKNLIPLLNKINNIDSEMIIYLNFKKCFELIYKNQPIYDYDDHFSDGRDDFIDDKKDNYVIELLTNINHVLKFKQYNARILNYLIIMIIIDYCIRNDNPFYEYIDVGDMKYFKKYCDYFCHFNFDKKEFNKLFENTSYYQKFIIYGNYDLCKFDFDLIEDKHFSKYCNKEKFKLKQQKQLIKKRQSSIKSANMIY